jgi:RNA polymerase sigma-70 factor (ECF subfamily)
VKDPGNISGSGERPSLPSGTCSRLLAGLKARDPDAWRQLAALYGPLVFRWCSRQGLQTRDAEDVVQEVFLVVLNRVSDFRHDRPGDTFRGWLWEITRNKLGDWMQRQRTQEHAAGGTDAHNRLLQAPAEEPPALPDAPDEADAAALYQRALDLIRPEFEERTWQAFWRTAVGGQVPADVAAELGLSRNAVYIARSRILHRLREVLGEE